MPDRAQRICPAADCGYKGKPQPESSFYMDRSRASGKAFYCKSCCKARSTKYNGKHSERVAKYHKKYNRKYRAINKRRNQLIMKDNDLLWGGVADQLEEKECPKCKKVKPLSDFYKDNSRKDGHSVICKDDMREYERNRKKEKNAYMKQYRKDNAEKYRKYQKDFRERNKERNQAGDKKQENENVET